MIRDINIFKTDFAHFAPTRTKLHAASLCLTHADSSWYTHFFVALWTKEKTSHHKQTNEFISINNITSGEIYEYKLLYPPLVARGVRES